MKVKIGVSIYSPFFWANSYFYFWVENQCDSDNEKEKETTKAKGPAKFDDEDQVDPEEMARKKKEE